MGIKNRGYPFSIRYLGPLCVWVIEAYRTGGRSFQWQKVYLLLQTLLISDCILHLSFPNEMLWSMDESFREWSPSFSIFCCNSQQGAVKIRVVFFPWNDENCCDATQLKGHHLFFGLMQLLVIRGLKAQFRAGAQLATTLLFFGEMHAIIIVTTLELLSAPH
jgi:hypothetical protein